MTDNIISQTIDKMTNQVVSAEEKFIRQFMDYRQISLEEFIENYEIETKYVYPYFAADPGNATFRADVYMRIKLKDQNVTGTDEGVSDQT